MKIATCIPTMPQRADYLAELTADLKTRHWVQPVCVSMHSDSRLDLVNGLEFTLRCAPDADWIMHLDDDILLGPSFDEIPERLAEVAGDPQVGLVSFFLMSERPDGWTRVSPSSFSNTPCCLIRASLFAALDFRSFSAAWFQHHPEHHHATDLVLGAWLSAQHMTTMLWTPSLVQHREGPSTFKGRNKKRHSPSYRRVFGG